MEFSFGTNWADYSRFVGDIFGAPLAAEALFASVYVFLFIGWARVISRFIERGPVGDAAPAANAADNDAVKEGE